MGPGPFQRQFEAIFILGSLLHELSHVAVYRAAGIEYDLHLTFFDDNMVQSHVQPHEFPSTATTVCCSMAPYSLLLLAVPMTVLVGATLSLGSPIGFPLAVLLSVQGIGVVLFAFPSKADLMSLFAQAGLFNGRLWVLTRWTNATLRGWATIVWMLVTIGYVLGAGLELPPSGWLLAIGIFVGFWAAIGIGDAFDEGVTFQTAADLRTHYAALLRDQGDREAAIYQLRQAIAVLDEKDIDNAVPYAFCGECLFERQQTDAGIQYCRRGVETDPESIVAHLSSAGLLLREDRYHEAKPHCLRALDLASAEDGQQRVYAALAHSNYATLLSELGIHDDAEAHCLRALEITDTNPTLYAEYGAVLAERGAFAAAERQFQRAIDLDPTDAWVRTEYAAFHDTYGDDAEAERQFDFAIDMDPDNLRARERYTSFLDGLEERSVRSAETTEA